MFNEENAFEENFDSGCRKMHEYEDYDYDFKKMHEYGDCDCNLQKMYEYEGHDYGCEKMHEIDAIFCGNVELAQAYVPFQRVYKLYSPEMSLRRGTVFPELDKPHNEKQYWNIKPVMEL